MTRFQLKNFFKQCLKFINRSMDPLISFCFFAKSFEIFTNSTFTASLLTAKLLIEIGIIVINVRYSMFIAVSARFAQ